MKLWCTLFHWPWWKRYDETVAGTISLFRCKCEVCGRLRGFLG